MTESKTCSIQFSPDSVLKQHISRSDIFGGILTGGRVMLKKILDVNAGQCKRQRGNSRQEFVCFCENLKHIVMSVSWGGHESLILPRCAGLASDNFDAGNAEHGMLRIYVGLESAVYQIADLNQSFRSSF